MAHHHHKQSIRFPPTASSLLRQLMHPSEREKELAEKRVVKDFSKYIENLARPNESKARPTDDTQTFWLVVLRRRALRRFRKSPGGGGLRAYLKTIFLNYKRDAVRAARVDALTHGDTLNLSVVRELPAPRACPAEYLVQKLGVDFLSRCAATLLSAACNPELFRALQGFLISNEGSIADAAKQLHKSETALRYHRDRMREQYRALVLKERRKLGACADELDQVSKAFEEAWK